MTPINEIIKHYMEEMEDKEIYTASVPQISSDISNLVQAVHAKESISSAASVLCNYCQNDECEKCIVQNLVDDAVLEAENAGWSD